MLTLIALATTATPLALPSLDVCTTMVPPRLAAQLQRDLADYLLPQLTDAGVNRLKEIADRGAWPCPFVVLGDFEGDGTWDRAILLKHKSLPSVKLITARNVNGLWQIDLQMDWPIAIATAMVEPLSAGLYEQRKTPVKAGVSPAVQLDNLVSIQADHAGFSVGQAEGAKLAYFYQNDGWQHLLLEE